MEAARDNLVEAIALLRETSPGRTSFDGIVKFRSVNPKFHASDECLPGEIFFFAFVEPRPAETLPDRLAVGEKAPAILVNRYWLNGGAL